MRSIHSEGASLAVDMTRYIPAGWTGVPLRERSRAAAKFALYWHGVPIAAILCLISPKSISAAHAP